MPIVLMVLVLWNAATFLMMYIDKRKARRHRRRIPEATLFAAAALGGSLGIWAGMYAFRHKTLHRSFTWGIPAILLVQLLLVSALWRVLGPLF